ncbi:hypothetical protein D210916BOD24_19180 [Alteromonas sp. D210916BOD_24]|uniref:sulfotransferase domain-containing protein n=1 Tax=Alteromonas sp. D210916BOD_24 TaxID=3157618 RepID=UPI00399CCD33
MLDFILVGPRKTASTWLHDVMKNHPSVQLPETTKETYFFDKFYTEKKEQYEKRYYKKNCEKKIRGEFSPSYFTNHEALYRIKKSNPETKIAICIRDPSQRLISDYLHHVRYGKTKSRILEAINERNDLIDSSNYHKNINKWKSEFSNVKVFYYEDIKKDPQKFIDEFCCFIRAEKFNIDNIAASNKSNIGGAYSNYYIAKYTSFVTEKLRTWNLLFIIELFKRLGLKKILLRSKERKKEELIHKKEIEEINNIMKAETIRYENRLY